MKTKLLYLLLVVCLVGIGSCNKDKDSDDPAYCAGSYLTDLNEEYSVMISAALAYTMGPTVENCNTYKTAMQTYLDALRPYGNCAALAGESRTQWQASIDNAEADLADLDCSSIEE
ncbi:MAG: hypothetical protein HC906_06985 [Bacteroidales bacterium]|nr:hypothetical protein [Bacteroidales bacterium]